RAYPIVAQYLNDMITAKYVADGVGIDDACSPDTYRGMNMEFSVYIANDGDNKGDHMSWEDMLPAIKEQSDAFGIVFAKDAWPALHFKPTPIERYAGPWDKPLKHPLLLLNNEVDPQTPLEWAQNTADLLGDNAVLVTREGFGHSVINLPSKCIQQITINFFNNGTYPEPDTVCKVDTGLFATTTRKLEDSVDAVEAAREGLAALAAQPRRHRSNALGRVHG
ncbi:hypothetical protein As57867_004085, partial [Aphanomyces stellatus]